MLSTKAWKRVLDALSHFWKYGGEWNANLFVESANLLVPEEDLRQVLLILAKYEFVELKSWSQSAWCHRDYRQFPTADSFFHNVEDSYYVQVRPLVSF